MSRASIREPTVFPSPPFIAVRDLLRRHIVALLLDRVSSIDEEELAIQLAALEEEKSLLDVTKESAQSIHAELLHVHLPTLSDIGLIEWDREAKTVTTTDHPVLDDPKFKQIIETEAIEWDGILANLANKRRRIALSILKNKEEPIARADLAGRIVEHEMDENTTPDLEAVADLCIALHHIHLPKLEKAGLITYDIETGTATYEGYSKLDDEWLDFRLNETPRAILPSAHQSENIWSIEGRDNVIARGQSLFEQADNELFLMFTTDGLLEEGCIRRLRDAVDRGVDIYLGSQTPEVRDLVREHVPEAVIWEPQMDWLNLPPKYEKVGRLVYADRNAVMLATLGEKEGEGFHDETAITGAGENNALVILLRDLLGSRLDHLDAQSEDFRSQIPL